VVEVVLSSVSLRMLYDNVTILVLSRHYGTICHVIVPLLSMRNRLSVSKINVLGGNGKVVVTVV